MDCFTKIIEDRIQRAQQEGAFENLPGNGKPLDFEDDSFIPEDLRLSYKILKNAGCLPIEMELRKEIYNLRQLLDRAIDPETRRKLHKELTDLRLRFNLHHKVPANLDLP